MPRNREIMRVFHDLDMVEQLGSGMRRILRTYNENSFSFTDNFMRTSFYFDEKDVDRINDRINGNDILNDTLNLSDKELVVFNEIKRNPSVRVPELIEYTGFSEPTINRALKTLRETGLIVRVGAKKNGHWVLATSD